jgi:hypothetical protein
MEGGYDSGRYELNSINFGGIDFRPVEEDFREGSLGLSRHNFDEYV